ncbi:MAG: hypothetical protein IJ744_06705 [Lachnospiraceae bacterium]|nr:hypothetical protein [Lachnospiraceae bacterium]
MCYYLYGSLYGDVSKVEYENVSRKYDYKIALGTKHDVKNAVKASFDFVQDDYRITDWICDCDSPVGKHDPYDQMIVDLCTLVQDLASLSGAKSIYICKTWAGKHNKREISQKLKDTNLPMFLADLQENCLYCLEI